MADVKYPAHLFIEFNRIGEIWMIKVDGVPGWGF
jgi:hypothetical protein